MKDKLNSGKKQKVAIIMALFIIGGFLLSANFISAQVTVPAGPGLDVGLEPTEAIGLPATDIRIIIARIIRVILGFVGIIGVIIVLYGGYTWMTAAGNEEKISQAKKILLNGGIGLIIVLSAFSITSFIISRLQAALVGEFAPTPGAGPFVGGGLGVGIIESHYPARNATGIPRNTKIIVTFKEKMLLESLVNDNGTPDDLTDDFIQPESVRIRRTVDDRSAGPFVVNVRAAYTDDLRSFVFDPFDLLGTATENVSYTVALTDQVKRSNGQSAFGGLGSYDWSFEVSTLVDSEPPQVESVIPVADSVNPRNIIIQINFNEAMDPTTVTGSTGVGFNKLVVYNSTDQSPVSGTFNVSNQYKTVEFISNDKCGVNSCGEDVFCLPGDKEILVTVKAASLSEAPPEALFPYNGVVDVVGNSLDGNQDNAADGPPADDYFWQFQTNNTIDLTPPIIESLGPDKFSAGVALDEVVAATFSKLISASSLNTSNLVLEGINYWTGARNNMIEQKTTGLIFHDLFSQDTPYNPFVTSGVRDIYQNCYQPCIGP
ncbi:MAG TPA: Ig-like domain-containing protein [Patescibacteria group bacterium]